jgi:hypothetical protein
MARHTAAKRPRHTAAKGSEPRIVGELERLGWSERPTVSLCALVPPGIGWTTGRRSLCRLTSGSPSWPRTGGWRINDHGSVEVQVHGRTALRLEMIEHGPPPEPGRSSRRHPAAGRGRPRYAGGLRWAYLPVAVRQDVPILMAYSRVGGAS